MKREGWVLDDDIGASVGEPQGLRWPTSEQPQYLDRRLAANTWTAGSVCHLGWARKPTHPPDASTWSHGLEGPSLPMAGGSLLRRGEEAVRPLGVASAN
jgi:hypothetical protein